MAPTAACKFGSRCSRIGSCTFSHPAWVAGGKFGDKHCREGISCANLKCGFAHPGDWPHVQSPCPPAAAAAPTPWVACGKFGDKRCRDGGACSNTKCGFAHPAEWIHLQPSPKEPPPKELSPPPAAVAADAWVACGKFGDRRCRDGSACRNAMCGFAHPRDWVHFHGTMTLDGQQQQQEEEEEEEQQQQQQQHSSAPQPAHPEEMMMMSADEAAWLEEQMMANEVGAIQLAEAEVEPPPPPPPPLAPSVVATKDCSPSSAPPPFIETNFTTRIAYEAWVTAGVAASAVTARV